MKLCINCKHYYLQPDAYGKTHLGRCQALSVKSPVNGEPTPPDQLDFCSVMRLAHNKDCGLSAIRYEEKEVPNV
jgi:hypothetical protein